MLKLLVNIMLFTNIFSLVECFKLSSFPIVKHNKQVIQMNSHFCPEYLEKYTKLVNEDQGELIVKQISSLFPHMDSISHYVLHTNDVMINYILNNDHLKMETKKFLVIMLVEMTQAGDASGGYILSFYHDLVNCLL